MFFTAVVLLISKDDTGGTTATVDLTIYNTKGCNPGVVSTVFKIVSPIGVLSERLEEHASDGR